MKNRFPDLRRQFQVLGHAFWPIQYSSHFSMISSQDSS